MDQAGWGVMNVEGTAGVSVASPTVGPDSHVDACFHGKAQVHTTRVLESREVPVPRPPSQTHPRPLPLAALGRLG